MSIITTSGGPRGPGNFMCTLCRSKFTKPKILNCYHMFCLDCLKEHVRCWCRNGLFPCPICKVLIPLPVWGGLEAFTSPQGYVSTEPGSPDYVKRYHGIKDDVLPQQRYRGMGGQGHNQESGSQVRFHDTGSQSRYQHTGNQQTYQDIGSQRLYNDEFKRQLHRPY